MEIKFKRGWIAQRKSGDWVFYENGRIAAEDEYSLTLATDRIPDQMFAIMKALQQEV